MNITKTHRFLIVAANTEYGKTHTTLSLLRALAESGRRVGAIKPIETGVDPLPLDGQQLYGLCCELNPEFSQTITLEDVVPVRYPLPAAPSVARGDESIDYAAIRKALEKIESVCDIVLIESAGGVMTPLDESHHVIDLADMLEARPLFVATDRLGMISETLVHLEFLRSRGHHAHWCINRRPDTQGFDTITRPFWEERDGAFYPLPESLDAFVRTLLP